MIKSFYCFIPLMILLIASCKESVPTYFEKGEVSIDGRILNFNGQVSIYSLAGTSNRRIILSETHVDSTGSFILKFQIDTPVQAFLTFNKYQIEMFLMPGNSMVYYGDFNMLYEINHFEGVGSDANNYLVDKFRIKEQLEAEVGRLVSLSEEEFIKNEKILYGKYQSILAELIEDRHNNFFLQIENTNLIAGRIELANQYEQLHKNLVNKGSFSSYMDMLPLDEEEALTTKAYRSALDRRFIRSRIQEYNGGDPLVVYHEVFNRIYNEDLQKGIKQFLLARCLMSWLDYFGSDGIRNDYHQFIKEYGDGRFAVEVREEYSKWERIEVGRAAPNFTYLNPDDEPTSLSNFRGNVVYIDVWATWCKPCLKEIPYSKALRQAYEESGEVAFMYLSIDDNRAAWKKMLKTDGEFKGIHLIADGAWRSTFMRDYMIQGIPKYILIDKEGKIANMNAPVPSSGQELVDAIQELLEDGV